jgi:hypothetical protein
MSSMPLVAPVRSTAPVMEENESVLMTIQHLVSDVTGFEPEETTITTHLDEFQIEDFPLIIKKINLKFRISLTPRQVIEDCETIGDLIGMVEDAAQYDSDF